MSKRSSVVRVITRFHRLVANDAVEDADLEVKAISTGRPQGYIGLAHCKVPSRSLAAGAEDRLSAMNISIRPCPKINPVTSRPFCFVQSFLDSELNNVQVESIGLAGATELVIRQPGIARAEVPLC